MIISFIKCRRGHTATIDRQNQFKSLKKTKIVYQTAYANRLATLSEMTKSMQIILYKLAAVTDSITCLIFYERGCRIISFTNLKMGTGKLKRKAAGGGFKKGNTMYKRRKTASDQNAESRATSPKPGTSAEPDQRATHPIAEPQNPTPPVQRQTLRSHQKQNNLSAKETLGNRIINLDKLLEMFNGLANKHAKHSKCDNMQLTLKQERKFGLGAKMRFQCQTCKFQSSWFSTYQKCEGEKGAAINVMMASALMDMPIGIDKVSLLFLSMDILPPTRSHMQELVNKASAKIEQLNEEDMAEKRDIVVQHNKAQGAVNPNELDISFDGRYNSTRWTSSYKPGQGSSQAFATAIENNTPNKYIVKIAVQNKLCWTGAYLKNKNPDIKCPGQHPGCTRTMCFFEPHSERSMAHEVAEELYQENLLIRSLTTDGDTRAHLGLQDFYKKAGIEWKVKRQADPHHLGSIQQKRARSAQFSVHMFADHRTKKAKSQAADALAKDIRSRSSAVIEKLRELGKGDITSQIHRLPEVCQATIECYAGNCSVCPHKSLVCSGIANDGDWWVKSVFLYPRNIGHLNMTEEDKDIMRTILEVRLSQEAVKSVESNTSTQKNEAFNRAALSTMPKHVNNSRNFRGLLSSKVMQINNSLEVSVQKKVESLTGHKLSQKSSQMLRAFSNRAQAHKTLQSKVEFKIKRKNRKAAMQHEHWQFSQKQNDSQDEYIKGQLC